MRTPLRVTAALACAAAAAAVLAGCGSAGSSSVGSAAPASTAAGAGSGTAAAASPSASAAFPVTVTAQNGSVTIKSKPSRIVSLDPTSTEDLYKVGAGPQVVAVDQNSNYPAGVPKTSLSGLTPNLEAIAKYNPALVISSQDSGGLVAGLKKLGIPVLIEPAAPTLAAAYAQVEQVGQATGHAAQADAVADDMKHQIAATVAKAGPAHRGLTYYLEVSVDPYYSVTSTTFLGQVAGLFGLKNIADKAGQVGQRRLPAADAGVHRHRQAPAHPAHRQRGQRRRPDPGPGGKAPGLGGHPGGARPPGDRAQRRHRLALGAAPAPAGRRDRPRGRAGGQVSTRPWCALGCARVTKPAALAAAAAVLAAAVLVASFAGAADLNPLATGAALLDKIPFVRLPTSLSPLDQNVLFQIRLPRVVLGAIVGGLLALAGAGYQGVFRNPLVDSGMLGASAGAGLGATLAIVYLGDAGPGPSRWPPSPARSPGSRSPTAPAPPPAGTRCSAAAWPRCCSPGSLSAAS